MSEITPFSVCVYCGSRQGADQAYVDAARQVGHEIGRRGWQLVYGGGNVGLMGEVAGATLDAGGRVIGVITERLMAKEVAHRGLTELHVVKTMHERKRLMAERAHAFLALAGGLGTLEELFEVWTWRHIGYHRQPIGLLDTAGFYQPLLVMVQHMQKSGFVDHAQAAALVTHTEPALVLNELALQASAPMEDSRLQWI